MRKKKRDIKSKIITIITQIISIVNLNASIIKKNMLYGHKEKKNFFHYFRIYLVI